MMHPESFSQNLEPAAGDDGIDLWELLGTLSEYRWTVVATTLLCFAAATAAAFLMTPKYQAVVIAAPADDAKSGQMGLLAGQLGGLAEIAGVSVGGGSSKETDIAYLKSRAFIESFIKERDLLPILFTKKWDAVANKWKADDPKGVPTLWDGYKYFSKIMTANADKKTGLVTLTLEWKDRNQAVEWANGMMKRANADLRERTIAETQLSLVYLEKELAKTSVVDVQQAIYRVMESQIKTMMMANVREQFAFKVIDPAAVVGEDDFVKPQRPLMITLGLFGGFILGALTAFGRKAWRGRTKKTST